MTGHRPPALALRLLELFVPVEQREAVIGDLVESHQAAATGSRIAADLRFWREAIVALLTLQLVPDGISAFTPYTMESRMQSFISDLRHAVRVLARARSFTLLCVATLGVAIGATAAIFSVVNPMLIEALPYPRAGQLVAVSERSESGPSIRTTYANYLDLRSAATTLQASAVMGSWDVNLFGDRDAERMVGQRVTWEYFRLLGVRPILGRDFLESDDTPANSTVVLLSHGLWTRRFGADSAIVGQVLDVNGLRRTVIGVLPASFENVSEPQAQIWRPLGYVRDGDSACRTCRHLEMVARVKPGVSVEAAAVELDAIGQRLKEQYPKDYSVGGAVVTRLKDSVTRGSRAVLAVLLGAVALVLLTAIANVVNLQLARAARRREEFAVRAALGAGRARLAQQLLAEGLVLALLGGAAGLAVAAVALPSLVAQLPPDLPRLAAVHLDWQALALVATIVLLVGVVMAVVPAMSSGGRILFEALRGGARAMGRTHKQSRAALVIAEVALATTLLIGAGLLGHSLSRLLDVDSGFDARNLVTMEVQATGTRYATREAVQQNHDQLRAAVLAVPGVESVGLSTMIPLGGSFDRYGITAQDKPLESPELAPSADRYTVTPDFLGTLRVPLKEGRLFTEAETRDTVVRIALVSEGLARRYWQGESAVGKYIRMGGPSRPWFQVIGVVGDVRHTGLEETGSMQVYTPERQWYYGESAMVLVARVKTDAATMVAPVRDAVRGVDPLQPISRATTMDGVIARSTAQRRLGLALFVAFGGMALLLTTAGIYGVLAGAVEEREREFGLRSALGATPSGIVKLVLRQAGGLALAGLALGIVGATAFARYLRTLMYGVSPLDPVALSLAVIAIAAVALLACLAPARRAVRVDPMTALRAD